MAQTDEGTTLVWFRPARRRLYNGLTLGAGQKATADHCTKMQYDFLIVGGGVAGGVLAGLLGRGGKKVLVLEKALAPPRLVRPEIVWPATTKVLSSLIPKERLAADVLLCLGSVEVRAGNGASLLLSQEFMNNAGIERWSLEPNELREQLLGVGTFELRRGVEVSGVLREKDSVAGVRGRDLTTSREHEFLARYTIGNDGVRSLVRQQCGLAMRTRMFPLDFLCFGFPWPSTIPGPTTRAWLNTEALDSGVLAMFALPLPNDRGVGLIAVRPRVFDWPHEAQRGWNHMRAIDDCITDVVGARQFPGDFARIRRPWGHAARYSCPGTVLLGDAAHPVSPVGGQGTNMAIADAGTFANLALNNVPDLLAEYERRRRPANNRSLRFTRTAARLLGLPGYCLPGFAVNGVFRWLRRHPATLVNLIQHASTAFQANPERLSPGPAA